MSEKNLLPDLAAYLYASSDAASGRTPSERELADHFTVSRGQIREALAILEAMRIVERRANWLPLPAGEGWGEGERVRLARTAPYAQRRASP